MRPVDVRDGVCMPRAAPDHSILLRRQKQLREGGRFETKRERKRPRSRQARTHAHTHINTHPPTPTPTPTRVQEFELCARHV